MEPSFINFNIYTTFPILCALGYALTMIIQKITSDKDNLYSQSFHLYIGALIFSSCMAFFNRSSAVSCDGHPSK